MGTKKREYTVNHSIEIVKNLLISLDTFGHYHPLIKEVKNLDAENHYKIIEQPFRFIPIRFNYQCQVKSKETEVRYYITRIPIMNPYLFFKLNAVNASQTELAVYIRVASVPFVANILLNMMLNAQSELWNQVNAISTEELF